MNTLKYLILFCVICACNNKESHNQLFLGIYYSSFNTEIAFFNFTPDSLFLYSNKIDKKIAYKINYQNNKILIGENKIDITKKDDKLILLDKKHLISIQDTITLNKINSSKSFKKSASITDEYWLADFKRNGEPQLVWYSFKENKQVDMYSSDKRGDIIYRRSNYDIINLGGYEIITIPFLFIEHPFLIKEVNNNNLILFTYNNAINSPFQIELCKYWKKESILLDKKTWLKIDSINAYELPHIMKINKNKIITTNDTLLYELGLKNKFLLFNNGYKSPIGDIFMLRINKMTKDTLIIERESRLGKEIGVYKPVSQ